MSQTKKGAAKAKATNIRLYGKDYYSKIGQLGGKAITDKPKGFAAFKANGELDKIKEAGSKGGSISRRVKKNV